MYTKNNVTIFNEKKSVIESLEPFSNVKVKKVCPFCKKEKEVSFYHITETGHTFCRGCIRVVKGVEEIIGKTFGKLTVISGLPPIVDKSGRKHSAVKCQCSCGKFVTVQTSLLKFGRITTCGCGKFATGENSRRWDHSITPEKRNKYKKERKDSKNMVWKTAVKRPGFCLRCRSKIKLIAHHIEAYRDNEELRFDVNNGACLCEKCHKDYHLRFMGGYKNGATRKSFLEWLCQ